MSEKYDCITFHTPACDEHHDRILNVHGPEGLDDLCPVCELERLTAENELLEQQIEALQNKCAQRGLSPEDSDALQAENERLAHEHKQRGAAVVLAKEWIAERDARIERLEAVVEAAKIFHIDECTCALCEKLATLQESDDG